MQLDSIHQSFNSLILSNMATALSDPVHQQIFSHLLPRRASFPVHIIETISGTSPLIPNHASQFFSVILQILISFVFQATSPSSSNTQQVSKSCPHKSPFPSSTSEAPTTSPSVTKPPSAYTVRPANSKSLFLKRSSGVKMSWQH